MRYLLALSIPLALLVSLTGCASISHSHSDDSPREIGEVQIRAAIIGHEAATPPRVDQTPARAIFVSLGAGAENKDPDPLVLQSVPAGSAPAKPYSACDFQTDGVTDKLTGARGVVLQLGDVQWENDDRATVQVTTWIAKGLGAVNLYHLAKEDGKWIVKSRQEMGAA